LSIPAKNPNILTVTVMAAGRGLRAMDNGKSSDPFVKLRILSTDQTQQDTTKSFQWKTSVQHKTLTPVWDPAETFAFECDSHKSELEVVMEDQDTFGSTYRHKFMGRVVIPVSGFSNRCVTKWYKLLDQSGEQSKTKPRGKIQLKIHWMRLKDPLPNQLLVKVLDGKNLQAMDGRGQGATSDPLVILTCETRDSAVQRRETQCIEKNLCPVWNESFVFNVPGDMTAELRLLVEDVDFLSLSGNDFMGHIKIPVAGLWHQQEVVTRYVVRNKHDRAPHNQYGTVRVALRWVYNPHVCPTRQQMGKLNVTVVEGTVRVYRACG
jgi:Ca2+-dependent lipid-binding protein